MNAAPAEVWLGFVWFTFIAAGRDPGGPGGPGDRPEPRPPRYKNWYGTRGGDFDVGLTYSPFDTGISEYQNPRGAPFSSNESEPHIHTGDEGGRARAVNLATALNQHQRAPGLALFALAGQIEGHILTIKKAIDILNQIHKKLK